MATTTNYSWSTPDDTALVKDGAAAIRSLGTAIDTTVFNNAGAAIAKTIVDAKGDLIVATAADAVARLASSASNGDLLTVDTSTATGLKWATPAGGGKVLQVVYAEYSTATSIASTSYGDSGLTATITPTSATSKVLAIASLTTVAYRAGDGQNASAQMLRGVTSIKDYGRVQGFYSPNLTSGEEFYSRVDLTYLDSPTTTSATTYKIQGKVSTTANSGQVTFQPNSSISTFILMEIGA
jgi:hypothetical protein